MCKQNAIQFTENPGYFSSVMKLFTVSNKQLLNLQWKSVEVAEKFDAGGR